VRFKLGIIVAMAVECRCLTRKKIPEGGLLALDDGILIGLAGVGPKAAERNAALLIQQGATALLSWGCAAALQPGLKPGDLVLPTRIIGTDGQILETETAWRERLAYKLEPHLPVFQGALAESARIVSDAAEKQAIFAANSAIALDMESAATARIAQAQHRPFLALRSIIDPADINLPPSIAMAFDENGMLRVPRMLSRALLNPADFLDIIRLGRHFDAAMKTLAKVAAITRETQFSAS
jgi:adenosylhomocysteine nucleosidase